MLPRPSSSPPAGRPSSCWSSTSRAGGTTSTHKPPDSRGSRRPAQPAAATGAEPARGPPPRSRAEPWPVAPTHRVRFTDSPICRSTDLPIKGFENAAHLARQRLNLLQARDRLPIVLVRPQEEQLGLGEDGREGVGEVVPELADRVRGVGHLKQRPIQIAQVMVAQVADGLPQIRLRRGAEDLGRRALRLGVRRPEQDPAPPHSVLAAAYLEANGDELSVEANGGEVVDDRVARVRCVKACRLCRHATCRLVWVKISAGAGYAIRRDGIAGGCEGWGRLFRSEPTSTNLHNLPNLPNLL